MILPGSRNQTADTHLSDLAFKTRLIRELKEVTTKFTRHIWTKAMHLIKNPIQAPDGQVFNLLSIGGRMNCNKLDLWTIYSEKHGYGVFHQMAWIQELEDTANVPVTARARVEVSVSFVLYKISASLLRSKFLGTIWPSSILPCIQGSCLQNQPPWLF